MDIAKNSYPAVMKRIRRVLSDHVAALNRCDNLKSTAVAAVAEIVLDPSTKQLVLVCYNEDEGVGLTVGVSMGKLKQFMNSARKAREAMKMVEKANIPWSEMFEPKYTEES